MPKDYYNRMRALAGLVIGAPASAPSTPAAGEMSVYGKAGDTSLYVKDSSGAERRVVLDDPTVDHYWNAMAPATAEAASTVSGWVVLGQTPSQVTTDDADGDTFAAIPGGVRIYKPGRYVIEYAVTISGGAANVRFGLGIGSVGANVVGMQGAPAAGYSLVTPSGAAGNYFTITRPIIVLGADDIRGWYYCQTATSHTGQIQRVAVTRVGPL